MRSDLAMFFDDFFSRGLSATSNLTYPPVNVYKTDSDVVLEMAVAGFKKDELTVEFDGQRLTVEGKKTSQSTSDRTWITRELSSRSFIRSFAISGQFEPEQPTLVDGVLTIVLKGTNTKRSLPILEGPSSTPLLEG